MDTTHSSLEEMALSALSNGQRALDVKVLRLKCGFGDLVSEVYSLPRVASMAEEMGMRGGFSLDLTAPGPDGRSWDFSKPSHRTRAMRLVNERRPYLLVGSPPCTAYSNLQNLNKCRPGGEEKVAAAQLKAQVHLDFCAKLYSIQLAAKRYFVHEHPTSATSWKVKSIQQIADSPTVLTAKAHMCAYGMMSADKDGEGPALKPTTFLTNSVCLHRALGKRCPGHERHVHLMEGRAAKAQEYPRGLCRAMVVGIVEQARLDASGMVSIQCVEGEDGWEDIMNVEHEPEEWRKYWDDVSGEQLDTELSIAARKDEIEAIHSMGVYVKVPIAQCLAETGRRPVGTRWVDTNKGDLTNPKVRCRLVAQEVAIGKIPELFAATPPIEYIRYLVSCCASSQWSKKPTRVMVSDVKKAYFYAPATRRVFVALPPEDKGPGEEDMCGLLLKSLYGTRDAAFNWTAAYTSVMVDKLGFEKGESSPCSFFHPDRHLSTVVHGDDFVTEGERYQLDWLDVELRKHFEIKTEILGPDAHKGEQREVRILNRVLRWEDSGICWEADPRHAELVVKQLHLEDAKIVSTPGSKEDHRQEKQNRDDDDDDAADALDDVNALAFLYGSGDIHVDKWANETESDDDTLQACRSRQESNQPTDEAGPKPVEDLMTIMTANGWEFLDAGCGPFSAGRWRRQDAGAHSMIMPPTGIVTRRTTRVTGSTEKLEDLWIDHLTSNRLLHRAFRKPSDIETIVEIQAVNSTECEIAEDLSPMVDKDASLFRAISARINFLAQDRPDLQFASKEMSRRMSNPLLRDWLPLKRIGRYLKGRPRMIIMYAWQDEPAGITAYSDSNWAGCRDTRKSTSGAVFLNGKHYLKSFSKTQANIALSTAEAELYAIVTTASEALGLKAMCKDFGRHADPYIHVDASAAIGIAQRKGLGKLRHLDTQALWIQDAVRTKRVNVLKVPGSENVSDIGTKHLDAPTLNKLLKMIGVEFRDGRATSAPELVDQGAKASPDKKVSWEDQSGEKLIIEPNHKTTARTAATAVSSKK